MLCIFVHQLLSNLHIVLFIYDRDDGSQQFHQIVLHALIIEAFEGLGVAASQALNLHFTSPHSQHRLVQSPEHLIVSFFLCIRWILRLFHSF